MTQDQFGNAIRIMYSLDPRELINLPPNDLKAFMRNPVGFYMQADDPTAKIIWDAMVSRGAAA